MIWSEKPRIEVFNEDCMPALEKMRDNEHSLAICDPPYGMKVSGESSRIRKYGQMKTVNSLPPDKVYFNKLFLASENQIIWGANNFNMPPTRGFIFWYKRQPLTDYAAGEYAWTSFDRNARCFDYPFYGGSVGKDDGRRIHPTQKPLSLYRWLLKNYAKPGDRILDTHMGSGSIAIACHDMGFDLTAYELDKDYYEASHERFKKHIAQLKLF